MVCCERTGYRGDGTQYMLTLCAATEHGVERERGPRPLRSAHDVEDDPSDATDVPVEHAAPNAKKENHYTFEIAPLDDL